MKFCLKPFWKVQNFILPTVRYPQYDYEEVLRAYVNREMVWLDVGCGHQVLPEWRCEQEIELTKRSALVVGLDYDAPSLKKHATICNLMVGSISALPFKDATYDLVTANMVVEHLRDPIRQFSEIQRVLKPGGHFIFHTPNARGYKVMLARLIPEKLKSKLVYFTEGRCDEDLFPTFYLVNSPHRIKEVAGKAGFDIFDLKMIQGEATAVLVLLFPLLLIEMLWIRVLLSDPFYSLRGNIIAVLQKPEAS